jgi:hypothetical protein
MIPVSSVLKTDGRGRVRTPPAQREALLDEFERSGLSGMRFAALYGVKYPSFANWVQRRRRRRAPEQQAGPVSRGTGAAAVQWLEAEVGAWKGGEGSGGLMLHLPCGVRVELTHPHQIRLASQLIQALTPQVSTTGPRPAPLPC